MIERYSTPEMKAIWKEEQRYLHWLEIEKELLRVLVEEGIAPREEWEALRKKKSMNLSRLKQVEEETRHEITAFLRTIMEDIPEKSRFVHYGLTSSDLMDTGLSLQIQRSLKVIEKRLEHLAGELKKKAKETKNLITIGRTHGMFAEPISFGWKFARFYSMVERNRKRLAWVAEETSTGKLSGAVGNYSHLSPEIEERVCTRLGLKPEPISSQVIPRDRYALLLFFLALVASGMEEIALEIRHLSRSEVGEVEEPFYPGQTGSSAMPHKKNPVVSERICGLSRVLRSFVLTGLENISLWHERDISHSSVERITIPTAFQLLDYILFQTIRILQGLRINKKRIAENLKKAGDTIYSQKILLEAVRKGMNREEAYRIIQKAALKTLEEGTPFLPQLYKNPDFSRYFSKKELEDLTNPHLFNSATERIFKRLKIE
ncbi:MAG: adenylosuccinate lyase [bacterium JZ-2024 1]